MISQKYLDILEKQDWTYDDLGDGRIECFQASNAGEDYSFVVEATSDEAFVRGLEDYYEDFDPSDHAHMWYGTAGAPSDLLELVDDANYIKYEMLQPLVREVKRTFRGADPRKTKKFTVLCSWAYYEDFEAESEGEAMEKAYEWAQNISAWEAGEVLRQSNADVAMIGEARA